MVQESLTQYNRIIFAVLLTSILLYVSRIFLIPVTIAFLLAILLLPAAVTLEKRRVSRSIAASLCVLGLLILFIVLLYFMTGQLSSFIQDLTGIRSKLSEHLDRLHLFIDDKFAITRDQQEDALEQQVNNLFQRMAGYLTSIIYNTGTVLVNFFIVAVYTYLILRYRSRLKHFILGLTERRMKNTTESIFSKLTPVVNSYITGVGLVILILSVCNTVALSIIGLKHALFFGALAGILNIIPFLGSMLGSTIPIVVLLLTKDSHLPALAAAIYFISIQLIESYFLTPNITGNKVKLNPLTTITALMLGALIWGIAGMILFIPILGILKVIFDSIPSLTLYGYLIGNEPADEKKATGNT